MNRAGLVCLALLAWTLLSCGSGPSPKKIDGVWFGNVLFSDGSLAYAFSATLEQGTASAVSVTGFGFTSPATPCFGSAIGQTATFSVTGHSGGYQTGPFQMSISTSLGTQVENVLTLTGTRNSDGSIAGNWNLTGLSGCSGQGTFTMHNPPPV